MAADRYCVRLHREPTFESNKQQEYRQRLQRVVDTYKITNKVVRQQSVQAIVEKAVDILTALDMRPVFLDNLENGLLTLAVASEHYRQDISYEERERLNRVMLCAAYNPNQTDGQSSFSDFALRANESKGRANRDVRRSQSVNQQLFKTNCLAQTDQAATELLKRTGINGMRLGEFADKIAERLGRSRSPLLGLNIVVTSSVSSTNQGLDNFGVTFWEGNGRTTIVLSGNWNSHTLEHELVHVLVTLNVGRGEGQMLFRAAGEAVTEMLTLEPSYYTRQREIIGQMLRHLTRENFDAEDIFQRAFSSSDEDRVVFFNALIATYGIRGYLELALLDSEINSLVDQKAEKDIYRDLSESMDFFCSPNNSDD